MDIVSECSGQDMFVLMLYDRIQKVEEILNDLPAESATRTKELKEMISQKKTEMTEQATKQSKLSDKYECTKSVQEDINRVHDKRLNELHADVFRCREYVDEEFKRYREHLNEELKNYREYMNEECRILKSQVNDNVIVNRHVQDIIACLIMLFILFVSARAIFRKLF